MIDDSVSLFFAEAFLSPSLAFSEVSLGVLATENLEEGVLGTISCLTIVLGIVALFKGLFLEGRARY